MATLYEIDTVLVAQEEFTYHDISFLKVLSYTKGGNMRVALLRRIETKTVASDPGQHCAEVSFLNEEWNRGVARWSKKNKEWVATFTFYDEYNIKSTVKYTVHEEYDPNEKYVLNRYY